MAQTVAHSIAQTVSQSLATSQMHSRSVSRRGSDPTNHGTITEEGEQTEEEDGLPIPESLQNLHRTSPSNVSTSSLSTSASWNDDMRAKQETKDDDEPKDAKEP